MMASEGPVVTFAAKPQPTGIMMVGLQGSGKTTTSGKLARLLEKQGTQGRCSSRPTCSAPPPSSSSRCSAPSSTIPVFAVPGGNPVDDLSRGRAEAKKLKRDTVIFDTAGRLAIDEPLMQELVGDQERPRPQNIFLVVDAMIGQDAVKTARSFHERLGSAASC
jgi:signal recognition particle subunit SRP54